jgi:hypothetical protein
MLAPFYRLGFGTLEYPPNAYKIGFIHGGFNLKPCMNLISHRAFPEYGSISDLLGWGLVFSKIFQRYFVVSFK